jgi:phosphatidylglycerol:prolipoprotein diacylglycerol transferase
MFPKLIDLGRHRLPLLGDTQVFLPTYGVLFASGALIAWWWFVRRGRGLGVTDEALFNLSFYTLLGGILGAKLTLVLLEWPTYAAHPAELLGVVRSAGVLMGGMILGAIVFVLHGRRHGLPVLRLGDALAAPLALGQAIGRLGCFAAGCCWGVACDPHNPIAVTFTDTAARDQTGVPLGVPLVPTQLLQAANDFVLALVATWLWRRPAGPPGSTFWLYLLLYSVTRAILEFWRGDTQRGLWFGGAASTSQIFALAGIVVAMAMLAWSVRRRPRPA